MTQQCPAGASCWMLDVDPERKKPAERLDISGRDPDTLTPIEILAYAYPDVHELVQQHTAAASAIERVRELHSPDQYGDCLACGLTSDEESWPWADCRTIAALDGHPA